MGTGMELKIAREEGKGKEMEIEKEMEVEKEM